MPKIRTSRTVAKRFKITATGKLRRGCTLSNHRMKKKKNEQRRLDREYTVTGKRGRKIQQLLGGK
ncbi:MAG TPA: bL35 family ribosomal protein [Armatimonadota bacterium]|nr:bL35 family ribosomal protein [Armatimonadota bacterium]